jgi:NADH dehydrogenase
MKKVVILGGGFAGVAAGVNLRKHFKDQEVQITLVDKNPYHLFTPSLYEVATSEEPRKNIAIPYEKIFASGVKILKDAVEKLDPKEKTIQLRKNGTLEYDYLIIALGSQPAYMGIPGLREHSIPFKWLDNAVKIRELIRTLCCKDGVCNKKVQVVIGGGGFAGTELAEEIVTYKDKIAKQNGLDKNCLDLTIIQGSDRLLKELDSHVSLLAQKRLHGASVKFAFGGHIKSVDDKQVYTDDGKAYPYEILIWTGGVEANHVASRLGLPVTKRGQLVVDTTLQVTGFDGVFAAGDIAGYLEPKTQKPIPNVAQVAEEQGATVAENIARLIKHRSMIEYEYRHFGYVVPLRGRFAVAELMFGIHFDGIWGWMLQQIVFLRYLLGILPFAMAWKKWNVFELELEQ